MGFPLFFVHTYRIFHTFPKIAFAFDKVKRKNRTRQVLENKAGNDKFRYFMVFDKAKCENAYNKTDFLNIPKEI